MAGLLKPAAARVAVQGAQARRSACRSTSTPTTRPASPAPRVLAAVEAGVDAVDAAMDAMSGLTSQPCLGSIVEALRHTERDTGLDPEAIRAARFYWEAVRDQYAAFESDLRSGASEVYLHEMPGGQFTNLKEQARSLGLETRWHEVARAYRDANDLFGDIVKVTPSSKVVGDMALMMVAQGLTAGRRRDPASEIAFPASVVEMLHGDLGQPPGGWPEALQKKVLKGEKPITVRPGSLLPDGRPRRGCAPRPRSAAAARSTTNELASYLMYPKVFADFAAAARKLRAGRGAADAGLFLRHGGRATRSSSRSSAARRLVLRLQAVGETDEEGQVRVFFELNGQPRIAKVPDRAARRQARPPAARPRTATTPMSPRRCRASVSTISVRAGQPVKAGDVLLSIEAMKMETALHAARDGMVEEVLVHAATRSTRRTCWWCWRAELVLYAEQEASRRPALLASVADLAEVELALPLADLIDLKDPGQGALGAWPLPRIAEAVRQIDGRRPVSATVGDLPPEAASLAEAARATAAEGVDIVKLGFFAGADHVRLAQALEPVARRGIALVAVLMADQGPDLAVIPALAAAGFRGVMLDTADKMAGWPPGAQDTAALAQIRGGCAAARIADWPRWLASRWRYRNPGALAARFPGLQGRPVQRRSYRGTRSGRGWRTVRPHSMRRARRRRLLSPSPAPRRSRPRS